jgi:hypothetical protein
MSRLKPGTTVHKHEGLAPSKAKIARQEMVEQVEKILNRRVNQYAAEHGGDHYWATRARAVYKHLLTGQSIPGNLKIDQETWSLIKSWVEEVRLDTGLKPPNRATKPKKKKRKR